jgi:transcriptional regulator with XRE-family HTH domain
MTDPPTTLQARVAEELLVLLKRRRMSATALARHLGVSQTYIWRRLTGETALDLNDLDRISQILGIHPVDLLQAAEDGATLRERRPIDVPRSRTHPTSIRPAERRPPGGPGRTSRTSRPIFA